MFLLIPGIVLSLDKKIIRQTQQCLQHLIRYLRQCVSTLHGGHHQANIEVTFYA
jgi:hypothetical protein